MNSPTSSDSSNAPVPEYLGLAALLRLSLSGADMTPLCQELIERAGRDSNDACALMDAAVIFQFRGNLDIGLKLQEAALRAQRTYRIPARQPVKLRLLALMVPGRIMANVPIECLLEDTDIALSIYYADTGEPDMAAIPEHDLLFVAIGESEASRPILASWQARLACWPKPVVNNPLNIERAGRDTAARLLDSAPGVAMPPTWRIGRLALQRIAQGLPSGDRSQDAIRLPLIVRPLDSHAGQHLYKIDTAEDLSAKLALMPGDEFFVAPFVDYRGSDGLFRKYRIVLIDGKPFACHMAISSDWMIHYLNAGMADDPDKRAEEKRFMVDFDHGFAARHAAALAEINRRIGLDYLGIDCAEMADGRLLIFEVDHAMVVHAMDPVDVFPYKQPQMQKVFAAFRDMLLRRAGLSGEQGA